MQETDKSAVWIEHEKIAQVYDLATTGEAVQIIILAHQAQELIAKLLQRVQPQFLEWYGFPPPSFQQIEPSRREGKFGYNSCGNFFFDADSRLVLNVTIPKGPDKNVGLGLVQINTLSEVFSILAHLPAGKLSENLQFGCVVGIRPVKLGEFRYAVAFQVVASYEFACWIASHPDVRHAEELMAIAHLRLLGKKKLPKYMELDDICFIQLDSGLINIVCSLGDGTGSICTLGQDWDANPEHREGLNATSHNLDTIRQALVVLVGFAAIWQDAQASLAQSQSPSAG